MARAIALCLIIAVVAPDLFAQPSRIYGTLLGSDDKPMPLAHVIVTRPGEYRALVKQQVDLNGSFSLLLDGNGAFEAEFSGTAGPSKKIPLLIERPTEIAVDVRLGTFSYTYPLDSLKLQTEEDGPFWESPGRPMTSLTNGTFRIELPARTATLLYNLRGLDQILPTIVNPLSEEYTYRRLYYYSVARATGGRFVVELDPSRLVYSPRKARVFFREATSPSARLDHLEEQRIRREGVFDIDWHGELDTTLSFILSQDDRLTRQMLLLEYLKYIMSYRSRFDIRFLDLILNEISPTSPLWAFNPHLAASAFQALENVNARQAGYFQTLLNDHPQPLVRLHLQRSILLRIQVGREPSGIEQLAFTTDAVLLPQSLPEKRTPERESIRRQQAAAAREAVIKEIDALIIDPEADILHVRYGSLRTLPDLPLALEPGRTVPDFKVSSIDDPDHVFTAKELRGSWLLIDFWATWCGPCLAELDNLHDAYERFNEAGLEILSISIDERRTDVERFRQRKEWPMPWLNAVAEGAEGDSLLARFGVRSIPLTVLVDPAGFTVEVDNLRGDALRETLERLIGAN